MGNLTVDIIKEGLKIVSNYNKNLSASDKELKGKVNLLSDGTILVAEPYVQDQHVLSFIDRTNRDNKNNLDNRNVKIVSFDEMADLELAFSAQENKDKNISHRQTQAINLIKEAVSKRASDIHFRNLENHTEIFTRVDGFLEKLTDFKSEDGRALCGAMYGSMCDVADPVYEFGKSQDGRLKKEYLAACGLYGARIATRPTEYGNLVVLRLLYNNSKKKSTLIDLGYLEDQIALVEKMTSRTTGINIFSGATGSGKSTSLEALLSDLLKKHKYKINLLTIEDPPEYVIQGAVQTPIVCDKDNPEEIANAWVKSISNAMRLDPDVIMIGEMRDKESAVAAFRAAMTGHGVWTTLHANNALQILDRLKDMGVDISFVTDSSLVTGLINQSLVPVNCPSCKKKFSEYWHVMPKSQKTRIEDLCQINLLERDKVFIKGDDSNCKACHGKGYFGRKVIAETVVPNQRMMNIYKESGAASAKSYWVKELNGVTKARHLAIAINNGLVDPILGEQKVCPIDDDVVTLDF